MFFGGGISRGNFAKFKSFVKDCRAEESSSAPGISYGGAQPLEY
jgi:hypothetical protein